MKSMNDINVIKPVKENEKKGIWDKIKNTSAVVATLAIMTTVSCNSKSEIEWTGDKDNLQNDELVEDGDGLLSDEETDDELLTDEDSIEVDDELLTDEEVDDELLTDDDLVEVDDELLTDEEVDDELLTDNELNDEDTIVIPETIVHIKFLVGDTLTEIDAGETIEVNGIEYTVKYDNNDGSIYLMNGEEINRIEWQNSKIVNGVEVSINDLYVDKTQFESRVLVNVKVNDKEFNIVASEESMGAAVEFDETTFNYVFLQLDKIYPWDYSGSEVKIKEFESEINGVKTNANDVLINEEPAQINNFELNAIYSIDLYNGKNVVVEYIVSFEEINTTYTMYAKENETMLITEDGKTYTIEVDKVFYDEINMKGWGNFFVGTDVIKTLEQDVPVQYDGFTVELKNVTFTTE